MAEQPIKDVYSLLVPISGGKLIVPRTAVSEVMGYTPPHSRPDNAPEWFLGMVRWERSEVPLICFEAACGRGIPESSSRTRITYFHALKGRLNPPIIALMTQGYPYLVRVTEGVLSPSEKPEELEHAPVIARIRMANERPLVPDMESLEERIREFLPARSGDAEVSDA
ncbi:chemosensory pili system protein ChpC [Natronospira proteinivora]|uniref:Chemosensory pili system protein ChpC n=1 Tax=Natronospira proteinivora TaxID=1807133 RepID=A0ABT1GBH0_9GAMM|nr:chemotaxis protein CheW [Natronospira proteinivora]MCP1728412.1 chemosensory pili system protein ChpC [Natronospira proteinivora]